MPGKLHLVRDACLAAAYAIDRPLFGQVERSVDEGGSFGTGVQEKDPDLAVLPLPSRPAVLACHPRRFLSFLEKTRFIPPDQQVTFAFLDAETQTIYRYLFERGVADHPATAQVRLEYQLQRWVPYAAFLPTENRAKERRIEATPVRLHYFSSYQPFSKHALKWRVVRNWNGVYRVVTRFESKEACEQFIRLLPVSHEEHDVEEARASVAGTLALIAEANEWLSEEWIQRTFGQELIDVLFDALNSYEEQLKAP